MHNALRKNVVSPNNIPPPLGNISFPSSSCLAEPHRRDCYITRSEFAEQQVGRVGGLEDGRGGQPALWSGLHGYICDKWILDGGLAGVGKEQLQAKFLRAEGGALGRRSEERRGTLRCADVHIHL